ncbi:MAG: recombinase XerD [Candidatus Bathyarchaeum sp.]|nr:MAG: recombinase XerD [Candidatus Bathyarchaeum sp.]
MVKVETEKQMAAGATLPTDASVKGKLVEFSWWMNKQGYAKASIRGYLSCLRTLWNRGANIYDPESIKETLVKQKWSANRKRNAINSFTLFLKMQGQKWEKPRCKVTRKIPFIPTEAELDTLIAGCGKKTATFLRLLKETAMRSGEAKRLQWTNIDSERRIITLNEPEKGSNPRAWKVTSELIGMLNSLPKKSHRVFGDGPINSQKTTFIRARKRLAHKLQNPRLLQISFHTFRHWKATTLYHQTKDPYYVKEFLGHKSLKSTEIYITIERTIFEPSNDEYTVKIAKDPQDIKDLLEAGFEYVCNKEELVFLRKRK